MGLRYFKRILLKEAFGKKEIPCLRWKIQAQRDSDRACLLREIAHRIIGEHLPAVSVWKGTLTNLERARNLSRLALVRGLPGLGPETLEKVILWAGDRRQGIELTTELSTELEETFRSDWLPTRREIDLDIPSGIDRLGPYRDPCLRWVPRLDFAPSSRDGGRTLLARHLRTVGVLSLEILDFPRELRLLQGLEETTREIWGSRDLRTASTGGVERADPSLAQEGRPEGFSCVLSVEISATEKVLRGRQKSRTDFA